MTMPPEWCAKYVGKPFAEHGRGPDAYDCWGLALDVAAREFSITGLPDYGTAYTSTLDKAAISTVIEAAQLSAFKRVHGAAAGTFIVLRLAGRPWHCAIAADGRWMLHVVSGANVCLERIDSWTWRNHIEGFYQHA